MTGKIKWLEPRPIEHTEYAEVEYSYDEIMEEWEPGNLIYELAKRCKELEAKSVVDPAVWDSRIYMHPPKFNEHANTDIGWTWQQQAQYEHALILRYQQAYKEFISKIEELNTQHYPIPNERS